MRCLSTKIWDYTKCMLGLGILPRSMLSRTATKGKNPALYHLTFADGVLLGRMPKTLLHNIVQ